MEKEFENITVFLFSDDLEWAKENLSFGVPTEYVEGCETDAEEWHLMSLCHHCIMPHSTFSFSASILNKNPNKKIFAPHFFMGNARDWILHVPVNQNAAPLMTLPPALSIIVYIGDENPTVEIAAKTVMSQTLVPQLRRVCEIIVLDGSKDGSGETFRQFAGNDNVSFIKINSSSGKFAAWNKGIDCARGDYVLMLTGKDFLLPQTLQVFLKAGFDYFMKYIQPLGVHVNYKTYQETYVANVPNIICSTQWIRENSNTTLQIDGIPNKKFEVIVDSPFKNLSAMEDINIKNSSKLALLDRQFVNDNIGTKFFKRNFLNKNNIRFDENNPNSSELKFLADTFLSTEKLTFLPQVFYGHLN